MASPGILNFEALLAPIDGDRPTGLDPRQDSSPYPAYHQIRDERGKARRAERGGSDSEDPEDRTLELEAAAAWAHVLDLSKQILTDQGKDLEIVSYLAEALVRREGFPGLRDAFQLARQLIESYWDDLYPQPDDDDEDPIDLKVKPISDLNGEDGDGTLLEPMRKVPITDTDSPGPFCLWHYQGATGERPNPDLLEQIKASAQASPVSFYANLRDDIEACVDEHSKLTALLDEKCGEQSPPSSRIKNILADVRSAVQYVTRDIVALQVDPQPVAGEQEEAAGAVIRGSGEAPPAAGIAAATTMSSREEAFSALLRIAQFFRQAEPHSPLSYTLDELVRRGRLPFMDLLKELVPNEDTRREMLTRAGIAPPPSEDQ
jgi:type VI secretion system protein ImpA